MAKREVYSWRLSTARKIALEEVAQEERVSVAELLDRITEAWLRERSRSRLEDEAEQDRLRAIALSHAGTVDLGDPHLSENTGRRVRELLAERYGR